MQYKFNSTTRCLTFPEARYTGDFHCFKNNGEPLLVHDFEGNEICAVNKNETMEFICVKKDKEKGKEDWYYVEQLQLEGK